MLYSMLSVHDLIGNGLLKSLGDWETDKGLYIAKGKKSPR